MVGRKAYLVGGRIIKPVDIYDPTTRKWTNGKPPPKSMHHTQCVAVDNSIWIVSSWTGGYPHEANNDLIYVRICQTIVQYRNNEDVLTVLPIFFFNPDL
jgi:hypothetical protein